jgi:hypothetical protein
MSGDVVVTLTAIGVLAVALVGALAVSWWLWESAEP